MVDTSGQLNCLDPTMPWNPRDTMTLRHEFVELARHKTVPFSELCRRFEISRQTGYKWLKRFNDEGLAGLADQSRRPLSNPSITTPALEQHVLGVRAQNPAWGGRKISRYLRDQALVPQAPAPSTITSILHRHDKITTQASADATAWLRFEREQPNELWQMDFKGHFATLGEGRCHPLTVLDDHSRFNVVLQACAFEDTATVQAHLQRAFATYGLPRQINTDNGAPWGAPKQLGQLTELAIWLIRLGIRVSYSRPYHPQTNGKDERFHRSLKAEVLAGRTFMTHREAQTEFERWRDLYNNQRPHEGIAMSTPVKRYRPSERAFPDQIPAPEYGPDDEIVRVGWHGKFTFRGRPLKVSRSLELLDLAARPKADKDGTFDFYFYHHHLMELDLNQPTTPL
jgi:transposase InsO family protein